MNKIHHKTLEAQKRREALEAQVLEPISSNEVSPNQMVEVPNSFLEKQNALIEQQGQMLQNLSAQVVELQDKAKAPRIEISKAKEFTWPLTISYYLFTRSDEAWEKDIPILDYRTMKRDNTRSWLTYRLNGETIQNQVLLLTLADWTTEKVDPGYLADAKASVQVTPAFVIDKQGQKIPGTSNFLWAMDEQHRRSFLRQVDKFVFNWEGKEITIPASGDHSLIASSYSPL